MRFRPGRDRREKDVGVPRDYLEEQPHLDVGRLVRIHDVRFPPPAVVDVRDWSERAIRFEEAEMPPAERFEGRLRRGHHERKRNWRPTTPAATVAGSCCSRNR